MDDNNLKQLTLLFCTQILLYDVMSLNKIYCTTGNKKNNTKILAKTHSSEYPPRVNKSHMNST